jgi:hypothetical protein
VKDERPIAYDLLEQVLGLELEVTAVETDTFADNMRVTVTMRDDPEALEGTAFGLIFVLGVLSFHDARPRGVSEIAGYSEDDEWMVSDMLRHLRFERGALYFYADYVRGRMMKTTIEVAGDGTIRLETINRGQAATRWVDEG